jgi:hypothetical protein
MVRGGAMSIIFTVIGIIMLVYDGKEGKFQGSEYL